MAAYDDNGLQGLELGDLKYLQTFCCSMMDMHFVLDITTDRLGKQLEGLPPSHPLDHLVFEFTNPPDEFPESWTRFDEHYTPNSVSRLYSTCMDGWTMPHTAMLFHQLWHVQTKQDWCLLAYREVSVCGNGWVRVSRSSG